MSMTRGAEDGRHDGVLIPVLRGRSENGSPVEEPLDELVQIVGCVGVGGSIGVERSHPMLPEGLQVMKSGIGWMQGGTMTV